MKLLTKIITTRLSGGDGGADGDAHEPKCKTEEGSQLFLTERNKRLAVLAEDSLTPYSGTYMHSHMPCIRALRVTSGL